MKHAALPGAGEPQSSLTCNLPDGAVLCGGEDAGWLLLTADGAPTLQLRTLPQHDAALQGSLMVLPGPVLSVLLEGSATLTPLCRSMSKDASWGTALLDAERLGLAERLEVDAWRLTERGRLVARALDRDAFVVALAL